MSLTELGCRWDSESRVKRKESPLSWEYMSGNLLDLELP